LVEVTIGSGLTPYISVGKGLYASMSLIEWCSMAKYEFACKDIGMQCGFSAEAKSQDELMQKIAQHAKEAHNMTEIPPETLQKVKGAIKKKGWF